MVDLSNSNKALSNNYGYNKQKLSTVNVSVNILLLLPPMMSQAQILKTSISCKVLNIF